MKKNKVIKIAEAFCDKVNNQVWSSIKDDITRDTVIDHGIDFEKMSEVDIQKYCEDQYNDIFAWIEEGRNES